MKPRKPHGMERLSQKSSARIGEHGAGPPPPGDTPAAAAAQTLRACAEAADRLSQARNRHDQQRTDRMARASGTLYRGCSASPTQQEVERTCEHQRQAPGDRSR
jgi:hypothetical protein